MKRLGTKSLYATYLDKCFCLRANGWTEEEALATQQEEADTRLFLHANHASQDGHDNILLVSDDTDVFIIALAMAEKIKSRLYMKAGTQHRTTYSDITTIASTTGDDLCQAILGMHALTGCDIVSSFAGRGKLGALRLLKRNTEFLKAFKE